MKEPIITIEYQVCGEVRSRHIRIPASEYYDPLDLDETWADAVERYTHAYKYLDIPANTLIWLVVKVVTEYKWSSARYQFLNGTEVIFIHVEDSDGGSELIHSAMVTKTDCHITRIWKPAGKNWTVTMDAVVSDNPDGSQSDYRVEKIGLEEKLAFADVGVHESA